MEGEQVIVLYTDFLVTQYGIMVKRPMTAHNEAGFLQWCVTVRFCRGELPQKQRRVEVAAEGWRPLMAPDIDFVLPLSEPVDLQRLHLRPALPCSARILNRFSLAGSCLSLCSTGAWEALAAARRTPPTAVRGCPGCR